MNFIPFPKSLMKSKLACLAALLLATNIAQALQAAPVSATRLLPKNTLVYASVASVPALVDSFQQTNLGRMVADPQIRPFVSGMIDAANKTLTQIKDRTGLSIEELARLPQGAITFAMLPRDINAPEPNGLDMVFLVDCGDSIVAARKLADKIRAAFVDAGYRFHEETVSGVTVAVYEFGNSDSTPYVLFEHDNTMAVCSNVGVAKQLLDRWTEGSDDCLAENARFSAVMSHCRGTKDEEPQITAFADPIGIFRTVSAGNPAAQIALAFLPALGVDGLKAVGASLVLATEDFDGITNLHVLLDWPRAGILDLIAVQSGDDSPPMWIPADVASYMSLHWDLKQTFDRGTKLGDSFSTAGATAGRINDRAIRMLGVDAEHDLLPALTGRFVHASWFEKPARLGVGGETLVGVQLNDPKAFRDTFDKIVQRFGGAIDKKTFSGVTYYKMAGERTADDIRPQPCFAMLNDWVLVADRPGVLEHILARRDDPSDNLATALDYKLIASKIARQPGGAKPGMLSFSRPNEGWKYLYDLATSDKTRNTLRDRSANNPVLGTLNQGLEKNPLPPWEAIARYLAPEGAMITDDDSGLHYMQFALRRK
jgi:hypothetical protein